MALREIFAKFGFDFDRAKLAEINRGVDGVKEKAKAAGGPQGFGAFVTGLQGWLALATGGAFLGFANQIKEQAAALQDLSDQTGQSTEDLQAWTLAANLGGASAQDFTAGLRKLSRELATGMNESGQQSKVFKQLKIDTQNADGSARSFSDVLPEIADRFAGMTSATEKTALAQELFGRAGTKLIPLLSQGAEGVRGLRKQLDELGGGFSPEAIKRADEYDDALIKLQYSFFGLKSLLSVSVFPVLARVVDTIRKGVVMSSAFLKETTALETAVIGLAAAISGKLLLALAPFLLPGLKFLAIFLAVDDLVAFLQGKDSVIGAILNDWFGPDFTQHVRDTFNEVGTIAEGTLSGIGALWRMLTADTEAEVDAQRAAFFGATESMSLAIDNWFNRVALVFGNVSAAFHGMVTDLQVAWNQFVFDVAQGVARVSGTAANAIKNTLGVDTKPSFERQQDAERTLGVLRDNIENNKDRIAGFSPGQLATASGPVAAPTVSTNFVELNAPVTVTLPPGTTPVQARSLAREAARGSADAHRAALQSLEQRGGQ